jgi:hypothetical protein
MAMMREQRNQEMRQRVETLESERRRVEELAQALSHQANIEWRKAIQGLVALPAAITVGMAASTLRLVGFVTRGLEIFQAQAMEASRRMRELDGGELGEGRGEGRGDERGRDERGRGEAGRPEMPTA